MINSGTIDIFIEFEENHVALKYHDSFLDVTSFRLNNQGGNIDIPQ